MGQVIDMFDALVAGIDEDGNVRPPLTAVLLTPEEVAHIMRRRRARNAAGQLTRKRSKK